jgi:hypothetical protein
MEEMFMKKTALLFLLFFITGFAFAQTQSFISHDASYIGKPVPKEFRRVTDTVYTSENDRITLYVENNMVISCGWIEVYDNFYEADRYYTLYLNLLKENGWELFKSGLFVDVYKYSNNIIVISKIGDRIDGVSVINISFYLEEYYDNDLRPHPGGDK